MVIIMEGELPSPAELPAPPQAAPILSVARPKKNDAMRAKVGDLVRYTPFFPEWAHEAVKGVIVRTFRTYLDYTGWKIRVESEEGDGETYVMRYSSGGALMIIREGAGS